MTECPDCGSASTEPLNTQFYHDTVERVMSCEQCHSEYVVEFGDPVVTEVVRHGE